MNRPFLALGLLLLLAPVASIAAETLPSLDLRERIAAPREVILAFADLCLMASDAAAEDAAIKTRGGTPITETPPPGSPPGRHFDLEVDGARARVGFGDAKCMLDIGGVDVPATVALLDDFVAHVFVGMGRADAQDSLGTPPGGHVERDLHLARPGDPFGYRLTLIAFEHPGAPSTLVLFRFIEDANAQAQAAKATKATPEATVAPPPAPAGDYPPSEDISGRASFAPHYPDAALKACASGVVRLRVSIDTQGKVLDVVVDQSSGNRDLDRSAMDAARQWTFNPGSTDGKPVGGDILVPINFQNPCPPPPEAGTTQQP